MTSDMRLLSIFGSTTDVQYGTRHFHRYYTHRQALLSTDHPPAWHLRRVAERNKAHPQGLELDAKQAIYSKDIHRMESLRFTHRLAHPQLKTQNMQNSLNGIQNCQFSHPRLAQSVAQCGQEWRQQVGRA
ncbi:hypothetical protein PIB30_044189, partial [Stylosanthes scabra]|nr:hypothetical protein [Stylosanthes scabra]